MPANRYRSRSYKRVYKNTPGGENVLRYKKKKPSKHVCAECGKLLHGVPRGRPYVINKLAKFSALSLFSPTIILEGYRLSYNAFPSLKNSGEKKILLI